MEKEAKIWFEQAEEDYACIDSLLKDKRYHGAVLFAQQSVEKILKAYIIEKREKMPLKTHRIEKLIAEAELDIAEVDDMDIVDLSRAYTWVRYPDLSRAHFPTRKEADQLITKARILYLWVHRRFKTN